ncbi:MAG: hypothetical protein B1H02_02010 [Candidatus Latescibacteria bacterium 4484_107]|nr:MAG: hypothetical protein B1H02_02010 [Candidatus Latescibacteria bacterium 4484_107]
MRVEFHPASNVMLLSAKGHHSLGHLGKLTDSRVLEWFVRAEEKAEALCEIRVLGGTGGNTVHRVLAPPADS